jgi:dipeptidyl-peptidase 4
MRHNISVLRVLCLMMTFATPGRPLIAAEPAPPESLLTVDRLFGEKDFDTETVPEVRWSKRSAAYFTLDKTADGTGQDLVRNDPSTGAREIVVPAAAFVPRDTQEPLKVEAFEFSDDESQLLIYTGSKKVWRRNTRGDYWVLDVTSRGLRQLGGEAAASSLMFAKFSPDASRVAYVRENNLYVQELQTLGITALTTDGSKTLINGTADWVNEEELSLRDGFRWSPDGGRILFWQFDTSGVSEFHLINNVEGSSPRITSFAYPKVGEQNSAARLGVIPAGGGTVQWLKLPGDPREHYLPRAEWTPDGSRILVQQFNRLQTELRVWLVDPQNGEPQAVMTETDAAWLENENPVRWRDGGKSIVWLSERSGWRHAYRANVDGSPLAPITQGEFDVIEIRSVDESGGWLYYDASPDKPTQRSLYRTKLDGSATERVSPANQAGWHKYDISPNAGWAVHTWSTFTTPPVVELVRLSDHSVVRTLVDNQTLRDKLAVLKRPDIEFFQVEIGNGVTLDGWCIKPPAIDSSARLPLVMYVYGEPHGQTVQDAWPGPRGLWHWMLAQQGFVVASVDNRGTNVPRGRAWRKSVHRQIGILAPQEQARAVRELLKRWPFVDPSRVGSWGWSGGGSMSLNAVFHYPDLYRTAIAIAPMADQRLYDTIYQERYMGLPADNANGFRDGSPLTHAHKLRGNLLLVHGTGDDNCHYQATERLIDALVTQGKHFTVLPYPNRSHAVKEGDNTERHLWGTMARYLRDNLQSPYAPEPEPEPEARSRRPRLQIINGTHGPIDVFWLKTPEERVPKGSVEPGKQILITTTLGHRFAIVSREDQSESIVTSEVPVQAFRFGGVPAFYTQHADAEGFPVVASAQVSPYALREAVYLINLMLARRPDVRAAMIKSGSRLCIMAHNEFTTDLPEWAWLADESVPGFDGISARDYRDARARGMGGSETDPYCSCAEENLLGFEGDPYQAENILIHELAHNIHLRGMSNVDPTFDTRVKAAYDAAMTAGLWQGKYASVNHHEYFAEGVQSWFDDNRENDHDHNHVNTRAELLAYDPRLAALCREVFGDTEVRYTKPTTRLTGHLAGYDPTQSPKFEFPKRLDEVRKMIRAAAQQRGAKSPMATPRSE